MPGVTTNRFEILIEKAENRAKALQKIRERQNRIRRLANGSANPVSSHAVNRQSKNSDGHYEKQKAPPLTAIQRVIIQRNRQNALKRQGKRETQQGQNHRNASNSGSTMESTSATDQAASRTLTKASNINDISSRKPDFLDEIRFFKGKKSIQDSNISPRKKGQYIRPSIRKSDYIEYDFSTMKDTFGGFLSEEGSNKDVENEEKSLDDWKKEQEEKDALNPLGPAPPPLDIANAPTCRECGSIDIDKKLFEVFKCRVCRKCEEKMPEKYSLLTKTECKEDYFLTEPELADTSLFDRIVKENPHSGTFSKMQLFLRCQVEEYAFKKWGGEKKLDKEWLRREAMRKARKEKKFNSKLNQMRRKLRAEELTRKFREAKSSKHEHDWSAPVRADKNDPHLYKRRCMECGMEVEEFQL